MEEFKDFNVILLSYKLGLFDVNEALATLRWKKYQVEKSGKMFLIVWEKDGVSHEEILTRNQLVDLGRETFKATII